MRSPPSLWPFLRRDRSLLKLGLRRGTFALAFAGLAITEAWAGYFPEVHIEVDGRERSGSHEEVRIPSNTRLLAFTVGTAVWPNKDSDAVRFRFKLEGYDEHWQRRTSDMGLKIRFLDERGDFLSEQYFYSDEESPGWGGTFEDSTLVRRRERVAVPTRARRISLSITSAGPPDAIGSYLAGNLVIYRRSAGASPDLLYETKFRTLPSGVTEPQDWLRDGTHASMAFPIELESLEHSHVALAIVDDDPLAHAEWRLPGEVIPAVEEGEELIIEWDEMHSIGLADKVVANYPDLPPGRYQFRVGVVDAMGLPQEERSIAVDVYVPLWLQPWVWAVAAFLVIVALGVLIRQIVRARVRAQLHSLQQEHMVERERLRIARDIHDDLGARLTHISLVSSSAQSNAQNLDEARTDFQKISGMTRELVDALYETVWTVDPQNDHLDSLMNYLSQMVENLCGPSGLRCRISVPEVTTNHVVPSDVRHHVSLAVKEVLNNSIKYSGATEFTMEFLIQSLRLVIVLADNGRGFDPERVEMGNGLKNIRRRMSIIAGSIDIRSAAGEGATIRLGVPLI